ncbi:MAG: hypothetical protein FJ291_11530 [Planctomycetes bacterium]|nr:hypothetical protein [Planctomycetota bacterium]
MREADWAIEEIRGARRQMSAECGHDPARLVELLQRANRRYAPQVRKYAKLAKARRAAPKTNARATPRPQKG